MSDKIKRHAVIESEPYFIGDAPIGECLQISYEPGEPEMHTCDRKGCARQPTHETLIGLQLCDEHFLEFYDDTPK